MLDIAIDRARLIGGPSAEDRLGAMPPPSEDRRFTDDDIRSALRNRELPLEALRYDVTPTGLHYLLGHFDIPAVNQDSWRLEIGGLFARPRTFTLDDLRQMPSSSMAVTLECAGNGRSLMDPFPGGQPWRSGGVSTAVWNGVSLAHLLELVGVSSEAVEIVFTGADRGVEDGVEQRFQRSLSRGRRHRRTCCRVRDERGAASSAARESRPADRARLVRDGVGEVARRDRCRIDAVRRLPAAVLRDPSRRSVAGERITRMLPRALMEPPGSG